MRHFKENGIKLLLEHPGNVRELLNITGSPLARFIDFDGLKLVKTHFVRRDYSHIESDIVLSAPLLSKDGRPLKKNVLIYILIEHQSEPDRLIPLRLTEYQLQIFNYQKRQWAKRHKSLAKFRLEPVLPIVFYTGTRRWPSLGSVADLMEQGAEFRSVTAGIEAPLFVNLPELPSAQLTDQGGYFGAVLQLIQQRHVRTDEFRELLQRTVQHLEKMTDAERLRWLDLLSYIHALVAHERQPDEQQQLGESIETSVQTDPHRNEVNAMRITIADSLIAQGHQKGHQKGRQEGRQEGHEEGALESRRNILLRHITKRFGDVPTETLSVIEHCKDPVQLDEWLDGVLTAKSLRALGIR